MRVETSCDGKARFNARLVAKGYTQKQGIDGDEIFCPVSRYDTLRAVSTSKDMKLKLLDVMTAFLYGELVEELLLKTAFLYGELVEELLLWTAFLYGKLVEELHLGQPVYLTMAAIVSVG
jgi:hypothetical protein